MSNHLKVAIIDTIASLYRKGWSRRRIARELEIDRETVARYLKQAGVAPKPAIAPAGSDSSEPAPKPAIAPSGSDSARAECDYSAALLKRPSRESSPRSPE